MTTTLTRRSRTYAPSGEVGRRMANAKLLQARIAELTAQLDEHRDWFLEHMERLRLDNLALDDFTVLRKRRHRWTYSPSTEREINALRALQRWEQVQGIAEDDPTVYISFSTNTHERA